MPRKLKVRTRRIMDEKTKRRLKLLAKIGRILGFSGAIAFFLYGIYWLTIPGGIVLAAGMFIAGGIIAFETHRIIRVKEE